MCPKRHNQGGEEISRCKDPGSGVEGGVREVVVGGECQVEGVKECSTTVRGGGLSRGERGG